ncbi:hypothetical protein KJ782_07215 [Patescibacteria group bacterium]|nr:hypothetical protein [Patescibacteria group bacterium]
MAYIRQSKVEVQQTLTTLEQAIGAGGALNGAAPALSTEPAGARDFVPFHSTVDGVIRMMNSGDAVGATPEGTINEGDTGGLFDFEHARPVVIKQLMADFGASVAYTISVVTTLGTFSIATGTAQYVLLCYNVDKLPILERGDKIKVVSAGTLAQIVRVSAAITA